MLLEACHYGDDVAKVPPGAVSSCSCMYGHLKWRQHTVLCHAWALRISRRAVMTRHTATQTRSVHVSSVWRTWTLVIGIGFRGIGVICQQVGVVSYACSVCQGSLVFPGVSPAGRRMSRSRMGQTNAPFCLACAAPCPAIAPTRGGRQRIRSGGRTRKAEMRLPPQALARMVAEAASLPHPPRTVAELSEVLVQGGASEEAVEAYLPSIASQLFCAHSRGRRAASRGAPCPPARALPALLKRSACFFTESQPQHPFRRASADVLQL